MFFIVDVLSVAVLVSPKSVMMLPVPVVNDLVFLHIIVKSAFGHVPNDNQVAVSCLGLIGRCHARTLVHTIQEPRKELPSFDESSEPLTTKYFSSLVI